MQMGRSSIGSLRQIPMDSRPSRGEIWYADLNPVRGHEQAGRRPVLIVSHDRFNHSRAGLVYFIPLTSQAKGIPYHVPLLPPEGGVTVQSYIMCEHARSGTTERLLQRWGDVSPQTMAQVEDRLRILLNL
jgi:mRNA interferase MazF